MKFQLRHDPDPVPFEESDWENLGSRMHGMREKALRERISELERRLAERNPSLPSADPATGLGNGGYLWLEASKLVANFQRTGQPFTLVVIDAGDTGPSFERMRDVLVKVSRKEDTVGLLGGPYFGVLVTHAHEDAGKHFVERVSNADSWRPGETLRKSRPAFGVAEWGVRFDGSLEALLEAAEADLQSHRAAQLDEEASWTASQPAQAAHLGE